jgi:hypothetical protein
MARAKLRKPFVVTLTGAATALACSQTDIGNPPSQVTAADAAVATNPPSVSDCPANRPPEGSSCPENGVTCDYSADASCGDPDTTGSIACEIGVWVTKAALPACEAGSDDGGAEADAPDGD